MKLSWRAVEMSSRPLRNVVLGTLLAVPAIGMVGETAAARELPERNADRAARALAVGDLAIDAATFETIPPMGDPVAVSNSRLATFPLNGPQFTILSTGDATRIADANASSSRGVDNGGRGVRGAGAFDVVVLRVDFSAPRAGCLSLGFRFLTEEFPEFVGGGYNDAFIAELDESTWSVSGSRIDAPNNFALDSGGNPITVDSIGAQRLSAADARGTTFDGATPILRAATAVTPGRHALYLSIADVADAGYDSAVMLDQLALVPARDGGCASGPLPVLGRRVNVQLISGRVQIKRPQSRYFTRLRAEDQIPIGSRVDASDGRVAITAASNTRGATHRGEFYGGAFEVRQRRALRPVTELRLIGDPRRDCQIRARAGTAVAAQASRKRRRLWGDGKGRFRTRGRSSAATVRGTRWLTEERCTGTLTRVVVGSVSVRDFGRRRTVIVTAGRSYLARSRSRSRP